MMTVELNMDAFIHEVDSALRDLTEDLHHAGMKAAEDGVLAEKQEHPYKDHTPTDGLTDSARVEENFAEGGGLMTWPAEYASFVDKGTVRSKAYPFTPRAESAAEFSLQSKTEEALDKFAHRLER